MSTTQSLSSVAYEYLLNRMRTQPLAAGERLVEAEIAATLGYSRVPVRQAMLQLVAEGYLVSTPRGYRAPNLTQQEIDDVFELRILLEPRAAALAARDIDEVQLGGVDASVKDAIASCERNDVRGLVDAGRRFRDAWLAAVSNKRLAQTIARYADQVTMVRHRTLVDEVRRRNVVQGYQVLQLAFAAHDSVAAHDAMLRLVLAAQRDYAAVDRTV